MNIEHLRLRIEVIAQLDDPEDFHREEDVLMRHWIRAKSTREEFVEWQKLFEGNFVRGYT